MSATIQPIVVTPAIDRLLAFYQGLLGAVETSRTPEEGPRSSSICGSATVTSGSCPTPTSSWAPRSGCS